MGTVWVRYKYKFAYGIDKKWSYVELPDDWAEYGYGPKDYEDKKYEMIEALGDYLSNEVRLHEQYSYSDKYRGFDYELVKGLPPNEELLKRLNRAKSSAEYWTAEVKRLQEMVDVTGTIKKSDFSL